jgi:lysophospholipase L1-like esterase
MMAQDRLRFQWWAAVVIFAFATTAVEGQQFAVKDGDTVVFYGDSITAQHFYTRFAEEFVLTRYPEMHVRFLNAGVPGDTVYGGYAGSIAERIQQDVAPFHPSMITVMLGMNDGGYVPSNAKIDAAFRDGYHTLLNSLHKTAPDAATTLILPSPYDETTHGTDFPGYSLAVGKIAEDVAQIALQMATSGNKHFLVADFHRPLTEALTQAHAKFPALAPLLIPDRIHPSESAHWIMAAELLSAWHVDPFVCRVAINANALHTEESYRSQVTGLETLEDGINWTEVDEALPLPLDLDNAMTPVILDVSKIASVDREMLRVQALQPGKYQLLVDARPVADFSSEELERGVNLALLKTPMHDQADGVHWMEERRAQLDQARFILSAEVKKNTNSASSEEELRAAEEELDGKIRKELTMKPHQFELRRH